MLFQDQPQVRELAEIAHDRLAGFGGLHLTPHEWLHMTTLVVGPSEELSSEQMTEMLAAASRRLAALQPITVSLGRVLYHPEAVMIGVRPEHALDPVFEAIQTATREVTGREGTMTSGASWVPHMTLCYSTSHQSARPIIEALGKELPNCKVTISAVSLVDQRGAERSWDWDRVGSAYLGESAG